MSGSSTASIEASRAALPAFAATLALALRLMHGLVVDVPSNDGVQYLWQAKCFATGDFAAGFSTSLPSGLGLLLAPLVAAGLSAEVAAEWVLACAGAGATAVLVSLLGGAPRAWRLPLALLLAAAPAGVRFSGEAYAEPLFLLLVGAACLCVLRERPWLAAVLLGLGYAVRPEAAAFGVLLLRRQPRWLLAASLAITVALVEPIWRWALTGTFAWTPLLDFYARDLVDHGSMWQRLLDWPGAALRGSDFVWMPLALLGLFRWTRGRIRWTLAFSVLQLAQLLTQVKPRFFQSQLPLLVPLGAEGTRSLARWRAALTFVWLIAAFALVMSVRELIVPPRQDKSAERTLGLELRAEGLLPGELVTDMPRVAYYAGLPPPPPAEWNEERLAPLLVRPGVRVVVLGRRREGRLDLAARFGERYRITELSGRVRDSGGAERLLVLRRR